MLSLDGPFLLRNEEPLFRAPRHLLGIDGPAGWKPAAFLRPGTPGRPVILATRFGFPRPRPASAGNSGDQARRKIGDDQWLTLAGVNAVLRAELRPRATSCRAGRSGATSRASVLARRCRDAHGSGRPSLQHAARAPAARCFARRANCRLCPRTGDRRSVARCPSEAKGAWRSAASGRRGVPRYAVARDGGQRTRGADRVVADRPSRTASAPAGSRWRNSVCRGCVRLSRAPASIGGWGFAGEAALAASVRTASGQRAVLRIRGTAPLRDIMTTGDGLLRVGARRPLASVSRLGAWPRDQEVAV